MFFSRFYALKLALVLTAASPLPAAGESDDVTNEYAQKYSNEYQYIRGHYFDATDEKGMLPTLEEGTPDMRLSPAPSSVTVRQVVKAPIRKVAHKAIKKSAKKTEKRIVKMSTGKSAKHKLLSANKKTKKTTSKKTATGKSPKRPVTRYLAGALILDQSPEQ